MNKIKNKVELLLMLLYAGENEKFLKQQNSTQVKGITRLEKLLFLLKMEKGLLSECASTDNFNFFPFKMGPWTNEVYDEVDFLESLGLLIKNKDNDISPADTASNNRLEEEVFSDSILEKYQKEAMITDNRIDIFKLTPKGSQKALTIWNRLNEDEKKNVIDIKSRFNLMDLKQFLRYIYKKYPEYTTRSEIKDTLMS